jgi:hypothetical protein
LVVELVPGPIWFTPRKKNVKLTVKFEVPKNHTLRSKLSTDMLQRVMQWERQKRCFGGNMQGPMAEKYYYNKCLMKFFGEEKMETNDGQT